MDDQPVCNNSSVFWGVPDASTPYKEVADADVILTFAASGTGIQLDIVQGLAHFCLLLDASCAQM